MMILDSGLRFLGHPI